MFGNTESKTGKGQQLLFVLVFVSLILRYLRFHNASRHQLDDQCEEAAIDEAVNGAELLDLVLGEYSGLGKKGEWENGLDETGTGLDNIK